MPPRTTRKSDRRTVSDRTMVGTAQPLCLFASATQRRRQHSAMNLRERQNHRVSSHYLGLTATPCPVAAELFVLTSPFIERDSRQLGIGGFHMAIGRTHQDLAGNQDRPLRARWEQWS